MKKIFSLFMALVLVVTLWVPVSAAAKPEKEVRLYFEMPSGMNGISFAGMPDLTGLTLVLTDDAGFTKRFQLPNQSDLRHYAFSDSEGSGSMDVSVIYRSYGGGPTGFHDSTIWAQYETRKEKYVAVEVSSNWCDFDNASLWHGPFPFTYELTQGQTRKVTFTQKHEAQGLVFTAAESNWYSFNITGDTTGYPYISVSRLDPQGDEQHIYKLDFNCYYAHSVSLWLGVNETVTLAAATLGGCFTGSFDITAAPAVLSAPEEPIKVRYHGVVPWSEILENTTYEPRGLSIALSDGGSRELTDEGWLASERGEFTVTILASSLPSETQKEASFKVKVEYDALQWFCVIFLGGFIWMKWTPYSLVS